MLKPHFSTTVRSGSFVFVSGQMRPGPAAAAVQTVECLEAIEELLQAHDLSRADIVKTTVYLSRTQDFAMFNAAYAEFFGEHRPARATVRADLMLEGALVEIEAIAALRTAER